MGRVKSFFDGTSLRMFYSFTLLFFGFYLFFLSFEEKFYYDMAILSMFSAIFFMYLITCKEFFDLKYLHADRFVGFIIIFSEFLLFEGVLYKNFVVIVFGLIVSLFYLIKYLRLEVA